MSDTNYVFPRLRPWSNGYLLIDDPAERIRTCSACGEDYEPDRTPCQCDRGRS